MASKHRSEVEFLALYAYPAACRDGDGFVMVTCPEIFGPAGI